jgi:hypothetical protein
MQLVRATRVGRTNLGHPPYAQLWREVEAVSARCVAAPLALSAGHKLLPAAREQLCPTPCRWHAAKASLTAFGRGQECGQIGRRDTPSAHVAGRTTRQRQG